jgi:hypothetical protein
LVPVVTSNSAEVCAYGIDAALEVFEFPASA